MIFKIHHPESLDLYIDKMIYFKDLIPPALVERLVPTPCLFLVIELDGMVRQIMDNRNLAVIQEVRKGWISGLHKKYQTISAHNHSEMLAVQFRPLGAGPFFPSPLSEFENRIVPAEMVFGLDFVRFQENLKNLTSPEDKFQLMEEWLLTKFVPPKVHLDGLEKILETLQSQPQLDLATIVKVYGHSHRQFIADFKKHIGTTPKFFQRILRFQSILSSIEKKETIQWSTLAYQWGFSDQSHLVREFQFFSGFVPSEFLNRDLNKDGTNFFPIVKNIQDGN